jgi:hypothetical protein
MGISPFEVKPRKPLDALPLLLHVKVPRSVGTYRHHEISKQSQASDDPYQT